ncbi:Sporulation initiation inhibitor protein soj,plasmid-partitioning protein RepA,Septum formation inhibitor-activating ATPase,cell division ATPase MinD,CobQ/CobB/MinD/ParA nucleotide binding domain (plasmid) [Chlamydia poikilotherma]|uniref:Sporulation initiation inhibitor protein soj,plasmid-partitioning protein RepA,Septum formation inhibitor-activating ATPase,cell division ATPase MinD,CobQ/CobB/MinD/ParA nucleotide binding domain n=1 Tax=Chlamydia poikilotherma TaxID=1967783 RepID=A0A3B0PTH0_9CHLA|nr:ParA family protein [Chlamydia poikilotherma]SYX09478.1 Sporulation initiation inhibitor protein soj,plasmid-partitioning protein RepA,Septum formation inhibitor-activating ATPase,cell division ATPase MinD,CobQ/CobB/MinD/ParA nucleotide binding domain [Chlamydia poikilotherma]
MKTLAFCSFKGGTGKTTLSLNIGSNLAQISKKRVLLVDLDPQANLTTGLGIQIHDEYGLNEVLRSSNDIKEAIHKTKIENLDIIPSSVLVEDFRGLNKDVGLSVNHLCLALQNVQSQYDICILDTPPSLGTLTQEAFLASQHLVVCLTPEPFSIIGLQKIKEFCSTIANDLDILGIVFSFWDERNSTNSTYTDIIETIYEGKILSNKVRRDITVSRSLLKESPVINVYPNSRASQDILNLTKEIENKLFFNKKLVQETL